jgi:DNA-binding NarL/FixJ family response regulator
MAAFRSRSITNPQCSHRYWRSSNHSRVLILTSFSDDDKVFPAIRAGAQGYLLKEIQPRDLIQAVREMHQGKTQLHPDIAHRLITAVAGNAPAQEAKATPLSKDLQGLTEREREVLNLIAQGLNNQTTRYFFCFYGSGNVF